MRIKDLREDNDLLQKNIADVLGVTQAHYSRIEQGIYELSYDGLKKLAKFYNTSIDYIVGLTNSKEPYPRVKNK